MNSSEQKTAVSFAIPSIDGGLNPISPQEIAEQERKKINNLINTPSTLGGWSFFGKILLGLIVGALMSVMLAVVMAGFGSLVGMSDPTMQVHPLFWLILLLLGFLVAFMGSVFLIILYNIFFSDKYTQSGKTIGLLLLTNTIVFIVIAPFFLLLKENNTQLDLLFSFYVACSIFVSLCQIEFAVNPNYSASALVGNLIGFIFSLSVFLVIYQRLNQVSSSDVENLIWQSTLVAFPLIIFGQGLWEIIYSKIYELGGNPFYLSSQAELTTQAILDNQNQILEEEKVNVDF